MSTNSVNDNIATMQQMQADQARLMTTSMTINASVQGMSVAAHTANGCSAAGGEVGKQCGNNVRDAAKAS